jgi:hypothetical protein
MQHKFIKVPVNDEAYNPRMFTVKQDQPGVNQTVTVIVNQRDDDTIDKCLSGCFRICGKAAKEGV